ncbi:MAG: transglutaminase [Rhodovulum sulfidophilum]|uniref:Transglutaminase n=1 Tax=Rhodovulum sulfidophilum TaxID=35806 RepID=A0A2W5PYZ1_RHOSU|nr:MAG: transglutaminase [Rhodovulum sulfidophilum]
MLLTIEAELDYAIEEPSTVSLRLEVADLPDQTVLESALTLPDPSEPVQQAGTDGVGRRAWVEVGGGALKCRYQARVRVERPASDLRAARWVPFAELPPEAAKYLVGSRYCQSDLFEPFVASEFGRYHGGEKIAAMRDWIETSFDYVRGSSDETTTVVDTFVRRQGVCRDYAHVMVTLARAARFPARAVSVYAPDVTPQDFHAVAEIYVGDEWRLVDATGMAAPDTIARIAVGYDAADIDFMTTYGPPGLEPELRAQRVKVSRE